MKVCVCGHTQVQHDPRQGQGWCWVGVDGRYRDQPVCGCEMFRSPDRDAVTVARELLAMRGAHEHQLTSLVPHLLERINVLEDQLQNLDRREPQ